MEYLRIKNIQLLQITAINLHCELLLSHTDVNDNNKDANATNKWAMINKHFETTKRANELYIPNVSQHIANVGFMFWL